ncbi:hypothetical protein SAMN05444164_8384 [Bradyrhizobium erythrophlei]|uniref:Uncharacterized protein n=1 Tax=Bradyrhizobium erythrophlei TaxID=1437360 RepID=A0A1H5JDH8_9BRAD|nr:hypothetical protein SAMN05444164_8384 [Bradyrhizobium erythrophlei]
MPLRASTGNLLTAPIQLHGDWSYGDATLRVLMRVRAVNLSKLRLLSDRQPAELSIENHHQGPPAIWLHSDQPETASIILDVGAADWCRLAYQFGHELGHVLANSWQFSAKPQPPTQWLEEALVETFSIHGLRLLADSWEQSPPFAGDQAFAGAIRQYRANLLQANKSDGAAGSPDDAALWFHANRGQMEAGQSVPRGPAILGILAVYEGGEPCIEDIAALNRWPERTSLPFDAYVARWKQSCTEIGARGKLPGYLEQLFGLA